MLVVTNTIKVKEGHGEAIAQRFGGNNGVQDMPDSSAWRFGKEVPKKVLRN